MRLKTFSNGKNPLFIINFIFYLSGERGLLSERFQNYYLQIFIFY